MATISIRFINKHDVERWEKLEAKGKLAPRQKEMLERWRKSNGNPPENVLGRLILENARQRIKDGEG